MDSSKILQQGMVAKYQVIIEHKEFDQHLHDYSIALYYGMTGGKQVFTKDDLIADEDGNIYLVFDTDKMVGKVMAECQYEVPDFDMESGVRDEVDRQWLCFVAVTPCVNFPNGCECKDGNDHHVTYKRVYRSDTHTLYLNLRTSEKEPILDSEGRQLRVHKEEENLY